MKDSKLIERRHSATLSVVKCEFNFLLCSLISLLHLQPSQNLAGCIQLLTVFDTSRLKHAPLCSELRIPVSQWKQTLSCHLSETPLSAKYCSVCTQARPFFT
jgi:hypothetical protein